MSTHAIMFHQAVADCLGLNATDHKCLDLLHSAGALTAGQLAELTGLTTGAITGIVDRLEAAGFVRREGDARDRRKVIIRSVAERVGQHVAPLFDSLAESMTELCSRYTAQQLETLLDFVTRSQALFQAETHKLRSARSARRTKRAAARRRTK